MTYLLLYLSVHGKGDSGKIIVFINRFFCYSVFLSLLVSIAVIVCVCFFNVMAHHCFYG